MLSASYSPSGGLTDDELSLLRQVAVSVNHRPLSWRGEISLTEREKLEFEIDTGLLPLDIYSLTLELERDEVAQGIAVQWNIRRPNNKISTREWQQSMQEEQYAGDCSVTLLYRGLPVPGFTANILFQVSRLQHQHYDYMREVLKEQNEKVLYNERGRTHELAVLTSHKSAAAARFEVVQAHYERLMSVLPDILDNPHRELRRFVTVEPANTQQSLTHASLKLAARSGSQWTPVTADHQPISELSEARPAPKASPTNDKGKVKSFADISRIIPNRKKGQKVTTLKALPARVPVPKLEASYDTYENRFLKMTLNKLQDLARLVETQLTEEINTARQSQERSSRSRAQMLAARIATDEACVKSLKRIRSNLTAAVTRTFLAGLGKVGARRTSVVLRENRYYRRIRLIEDDIETDLNLTASTVGLEKANASVRLSSINQLYEYWVTVLTLMTLVEKLGFSVIAKEGRPVNVNVLSKTNRFNYILQSGANMELISPLGRRVLVYYDREYPSRESDYSYDYSNPLYYGYYAPHTFDSYGSKKRRPDIAIEVFAEDERVPKIVVLDATYSRDRRTLYAKYEYRDTIRDFTRTDALSNTPARPVVAAWAIFPDRPERLEHDEFRFGQLPLQPGPAASDQFAPILRQLLKMAGAVD